MALDRKMSLGVGLAVTGLVYAIYAQSVPKVADLRVAAPGNTDAAAAEKAARWAATVVVVGVAVIARDATVFVMGGSTIIGLSWLHRQANLSNPMAGGGTGAMMPASRSHDVMADAGYTPGA